MNDTLESMRRAMLLLVGAALSTFVSSAHAQSDDGVRVHLDANDDVVLQQKQGREWIDACYAPCDRKLDGDARYRIEGNGVRPSSPFSLHATSLEGSETIVVTPSYVSTRDAGFVLVGVGAAGIFVGGFLAWIAAASERCEGNNSFPSTGQCETGDGTLLAIGAVTAIGSAIVGGLGAFLAIENSHSSVKHMASNSTNPRIHFLASDGLLTWKGRTETHAIPMSSSTPTLLPIVSVSF
jgi:hypothetical protein